MNVKFFRFKYNVNTLIILEKYSEESKVHLLFRIIEIDLRDYQDVPMMETL